MLKIVLVLLGGAFGTGLRYFLSSFPYSRVKEPFLWSPSRTCESSSTAVAKESKSAQTKGVPGCNWRYETIYPRLALRAAFLLQ